MSTQNQEEKPLSSASSPQSPFLIDLDMVSASKGKINGTDSLSQDKQLRVNLELGSSNNLITGAVGKTVLHGTLKESNQLLCV